MPPKKATTNEAKGKEEALSPTLPQNHSNATNALLASLAELEEMLSPLFATPNSLSETLAKLDSESRCQMELLIAYAINTFAFINLKANGTAPSTHPVMQELKRIKAYTERLRNVTEGYKAKMEVDRDAAARLIRGALASNNIADRKAAAAATAGETAGQTEGDSEEDGESESDGDNEDDNGGAIVESQGMHTRFDEDGEKGDEGAASPSKNGSTPSTATGTNRKRIMDPFQGYEDGKKKSRS
ncbi:hypothetical protein EDD21DRAFT_383024 [Dissophora ornata]|nr:hypothetical protein BGZ58_000788 [Dissophora ornata]KAI8598239.1 hypothetical protein EDD21DRAFT_383024 [Dissophora ornata]